MKSIFIVLLIVFCFIIHSNSKLLFATVITRHGDRTPNKIYPKYRSTFEVAGQLTPLGMNQLFNLGKRFRNRYIDRFQILSSTFNISQVYARSTGRDRTLVSAWSFMAGMYPKGTGPTYYDQEREVNHQAVPDLWQPLPIHSAETVRDYLLYGHKNCPMIKKDVKKIRSVENSAWKQKEKKEKKVMERMSEKLGCKLKMKDASGINALIKYDQLHGKLPSFITQQDVQDMRRISSWNFQHKIPTGEIGKLAGGNLLWDIAQRIKYHKELDQNPSLLNPSVPEDLEGPFKPKVANPPIFVYYSAHDGTILSLIGALRNGNPKRWESFEVPQYGAYFNFELHSKQEEDGTKSYYVKMIYDNDHDYDNGVEEKTRTSFDDFFRTAADGAYHTLEDWQHACHGTSSSSSVQGEYSLLGALHHMVGSYGTFLYGFCIVVAIYGFVNYIIAKK